MGMPEFNDGSLGESQTIKDLRDAFQQSENPDVKKLHIAEKFETLEKARKNIKEGEGKQLDRIENMLTSIILHFNIPFKGIIQIHNTEKGEEKL